MANRKVTKQKVDRIIADASYLQKEAEALTYVINEVPHSANPPEGYSIAQLLMLIDHAQQNYYRPIIDEAIHNKRAVSLKDFKNFRESFAPEKQKSADIQKILHKLANHRGSLVDELNNISLSGWETIIYSNNKEILLVKFLEKMNHNDQIYLKKITNLVKSHQQEKKTQRELKQRASRQNFGNNKG